MAATALVRVAGFDSSLDYIDLAPRIPGQVRGLLARYPLGFGQRVSALSKAVDHPLGLPSSGSWMRLNSAAF